MATFVAKSNTYGGRYLQLTITQVKNIADNTSTLKWVLESIGGTSNYYSISETTIKINGQQVYHKGLTPWNSYEFPAKKGSYGDSITVTHNSDGTLTVPVIFSTAVYDGYFLKDYGGSFVLDTIERTSTVSCTNADIGTAPTITINAGSSAFRHTLRYSFGSLSGTIVTKTSETQYTDWVLPESFYGELADAQTGTATIYCDTYNGDTLLGTESCTFKVMASSYTSSPTLSPVIKDTNDATYALTGNRNILVRYHSTASVTINAEAKNGATIKTQTVTNGNRTLNGPTCEFTNVEYGYFSFAVTDSRGYSTNSGRDLTTAGRFVEYIKLTCTQANSKPDANGNMTLSCSGNYFNGNFGAAYNTLRVQYRYKMLGGAYTDWASMGVTKNGNTYTASVAISELDYQMTYVFETRAIDSLMSVTASSKAVRSQPVFHWGEEDFVFEVPVTFNAGATGAAEEFDGNIKGDCNITGNLRLKGTGNYGNKILFGDGEYVSLFEATDDDLTIKATDIEIEAQNLLLDSEVNVNGSFSINGEMVYDYVVSQGTSGSWNYRKWNSGVAECWITIAHSTAITTAFGQVYEANDYCYPIAYPFSFISRPREIATAHSDSRAAWVYGEVGSNTASASGTYGLIRPGKLSSSTTFYIDIYAIGKWR